MEGMPVLFPAFLELDQNRTCWCSLRSAELKEFSSKPYYFAAA